MESSAFSSAFIHILSVVMGRPFLHYSNTHSRTVLSAALKFPSLGPQIAFRVEFTPFNGSFCSL
jgi:hypothetical protein